MLGRNHAASGAVAGLLTLDHVHVPDLEHRLAWVLLWAGCSLICDIDSAGSGGSRMWGRLSGALFGHVRSAVGGHRRGTHDIVLAPLVAGSLTWAGLQGTCRSYVVVALLIGLSFRAATMGDNRSGTIMANLAASLLGAWWIVGHHLTYGMNLPVVVMGGILVHCLGDFPTPGGLPVPVLWLGHPGWRMGVPLFRVGHWFENHVIEPALGAAIVLLGNQQFHVTQYLAHAWAVVRYRLG